MHVVYDLPVMLLNQRYWLRHAGVGAYLVPTEVGDAHVGTPPTRSRILLVSSVSDEINTALLPRLLHSVAASAWKQHELAPSQLSSPAEGGVAAEQQLSSAASPMRSAAPGRHSSLFIATWSFSEASITAREAIRPNLKEFDRLLIRYRDSFDHINNVAYLRHFIRHDLAPTHSVCVWSKILVAVRRSLGLARCEPALGCSLRTIDFMSLVGVPSSCANDTNLRAG